MKNKVNDRLKSGNNAMICLFILWQFIIVFAFWGGNPRGSFYRIRELQNQVNILQDQLKTHKHKLFSGGVYYPKR